MSSCCWEELSLDLIKLKLSRRHRSRHTHHCFSLPFSHTQVKKKHPSTQFIYSIYLLNPHFVLSFTHRNGLVEAAEDGDHVAHVQHPLVLAAEAVRIECFDSNIQRQEVNWKRQLWVDFIFILLPIEIKYFWSPLFGCNPMRLGLEETNWAQNEAEKKWKVVDARPGQRYTCYLSGRYRNKVSDKIDTDPKEMKMSIHSYTIHRIATWSTWISIIYVMLTW